MDEREISCCFSGHRPTKLPWALNELDPRCIELKEEIYNRLEGIYQGGYRNFICGMAQGCDMYFARAVITLREKYGDAKLLAAVPCAVQADRWALSQKEKYKEILSLCDEVKVLQENYSPDCMMRRNKYMVDNSSLLLVCYNGLPGGTMNTILYAKRQNVKTIIIDV